ncbi:hypothetical protein OROGR_004946 [Orobanche gracilis]
MVSGTILAPRDPKTWDGLDVHKWLYFHGVENLKVEGGGKIMGLGEEWWARSCKTNHSNPCTHAPTLGDDCISIVGNSSKIRIKNIVCGPGHVLEGGSGFARKITFENIWMKNVSSPIIIDQYYCDSSVTCLNQTLAVSIDSITFRNIKGTSATEEAIILACKRLYLENIQIITTSNGTAKSFCWEAYGTSSGLVSPPSCLSTGDIFIRHQVNKSNSTRWREDDFALF